MSSCLMDDYISEIEMIKKAYLKLREKYPNHELIKIASFDDGGIILSDEVFERFSVKGGKKIHTFFNYKKALEDAIKFC